MSRIDADARLRALLLGRPSRVLLAAVEACAVIGFALLMLTRTLGALSGAGMAERLFTVLLLCCPLAVMLHAARAAGQSRALSLLGHLLLALVCAAAMLARVSFLDHVSSDFELYLSDWLAQFSARSFGEAMRENIGEYNVLYQYMLFAVTRLPAPALYAVKALTFVGDACLAGAAAQLAGDGERQSPVALCAVLLLPTCVLNGGMFAQCDSLYAACALWGLALSLRGRPRAGAACFALSLAFKLQAVFLLPIVLLLWAGGHLRLRDALVFAGTLVAAALPAMLFGKSPVQILAIYTGQTGLYTGLTYNAPSLFGLLNTQGLDAYAYGNFGMALAAGALLTLLGACLPRAARLRREDWLRAALLMALLMVYLLPRMHERYFFLADALAVTLAARDGRAAPAAALVALASLSTYLSTAIALPVASAMMLLAIVLLAGQAKKACEADGTCV